MAKLDGWLPPKTVRINAGAGGDLTNYQMLFMVYAGNGIDGVMYLPSGELVGKVYANNLCKAGFEDVRFSHHDNRTPYVQKIVEKVNGSHALVVVKVVESLAQNQLIDFHFGNPDAIDVSSDDVFSAAPISGVVGAWPLDEADQEVNPTVIIESDFTAFWNSKGSYTAGGTIGNPVISEATEPFNSVKIDVGVGTNKKWFIQHVYNPATAIFANGSRIALKWYGTNSGNKYAVYFKTASNDKYSFIFTDDFVGEQRVIFVKASATVLGSPNWNSITFITIESAEDNLSGTFYAGKYTLEDGVPVTDYSGNGNHGVPTGTEIVPSDYAGKTMRRFDADSYITVANPPRGSVGALAVKFRWTEDMAAANKAVMLFGTEGFNNNLKLVSSDAAARNVRMVCRQGSEATPFRWHTPTGIPLNPFGEWNTVLIQQNGVNPQYVVNDGVLTDVTDGNDLSAWTNLPSFAGLPLVINASGGNGRCLMEVEWVYIFSQPLTLEQFTALRLGGYPDPRLEPGKIMVRKWATIALPVVGEWFDATAAEQLGRPVRKRRDPLDDWERRPSFWSLSKLRDSLREIVKS